MSNIWATRPTGVTPISHSYAFYFSPLLLPLYHCRLNCLAAEDRNLAKSTHEESEPASTRQGNHREPLSIADIIDNQLETSDNCEIGRVADIEAEWRDDGKLELINIITGPQALAGRFSPRL